MKKLFSALLTAFLVVLASVAAPAPAPAPALADSGTHFTEEAVGNLIRSGELPGAIGILCRNGKQETACLGWANVEKKVPIALDQSFMQCSQTKGFCGVTIAILVEEGKLSLDDPVSKYLPEFKKLRVAVKDPKRKDAKKDNKGKNTPEKVVTVPAKKVLTIRTLMNHTGGFPFEVPSKRKLGWPGLPLRATAREAAAIPLSFEPGTRTQYSNTGFDIAAAVIEVITKKPWDVFLRERVLEPLGMKDTTFQPTKAQLAHSISLYWTRPGEKAIFVPDSKWMPLPHSGPKVYPSAGAGLWTTVNDQLKFYRMLMNLGVGDNGVRILKEQTVKKLLAASSRPKGFEEYSLGLEVNFERGTMEHGGAWGNTCRVNWRTKELYLWVIQSTGDVASYTKAWERAVAKFSESELTQSGSYTGRLK